MPGAVVTDEGVEDVGAAPRPADGGGNRSFSFVPLSLVVGLGVGVATDRGQRGCTSLGGADGCSAWAGAIVRSVFRSLWIPGPVRPRRPIGRAIRSEPGDRRRPGTPRPAESPCRAYWCTSAAGWRRNQSSMSASVDLMRSSRATTSPASSATSPAATSSPGRRTVCDLAAATAAQRSSPHCAPRHHRVSSSGAKHRSGEWLSVTDNAQAAPPSRGPGSAARPVPPPGSPRRVADAAG